MSGVSDELVRKAAKAYVDAIVPGDRSHISGWWPDHQHTIRAALEAVADEMSNAQMDSHVLETLLEYAYRGEGANGGNCRNDRAPGCWLCQTFDAAEAALGDDAPTPDERNWWRPTLSERAWQLWIKVRRVVS